MEAVNSKSLLKSLVQHVRTVYKLMEQIKCSSELGKSFTRLAFHYNIITWTSLNFETGSSKVSETMKIKCYNLIKGILGLLFT